ncbi:MAG: lipoyl synthase [Dysgonamonadaceae bacterium]|jgi:lipoic acid synthetase|nr:lipoyl synthase [Dysgonamonadaceae bacterium]
MDGKTPHIKKPDWLKIKLGNNDNFSRTGKIIESKRLCTICQSGRCPNLGECWNKGTATFMIGGDICTRSCKFCNTKTGKPRPLDREEPSKVANSVLQLGLKHAVITSVDRDDLPDYGAHHWAETIRQIKKRNPGTSIEVLIPDFNGKYELLDLIIQASPDIISHNMETVERLTPQIRSVAKYHTSMEVLKHVSQSGIPVKSGVMLGLGETREEVISLMDDLIASGCFLLSIGQYLQPSKKNVQVAEYIHPSTFKELKSIAEMKGFKHVESSPLVRSSYHSIDFLWKDRPLTGTF